MAKKEEQELKKELLNQIKDKTISDLNKEIKISLKNQVEEYKKDLLEEINNNINEEVENAVKREEKRILRSKNFSLFKKNLVIILLCIICVYFAYCLYDAKYFSFMKSECEKNGSCTISENNQTETTQEEIVKDKEWYIENYGYLLENVQTTLNADEASSYYMYSKSYNLKDIKTSYLLNLAYKKLDPKDIKTNSVNVIVSADALKKSYENLFSLNNYQNVSFSYQCLHFKYEEDKNRFVALNNTCTNNKEILESIIDMYEEGNQLYIITTATIYDANEESYYSFDNLFDPVVSHVTENDVESNAKKLNKYQYIFNKVDDTYYFDSITKLK